MWSPFLGPERRIAKRSFDPRFKRKLNKESGSRFPTRNVKPGGLIMRELWWLTSIHVYRPIPKMAIHTVIWCCNLVILWFFLEEFTFTSVTLPSRLLLTTDQQTLNRLTVLPFGVTLSFDRSFISLVLISLVRLRYYRISYAFLLVTPVWTGLIDVIFTPFA